MERIEQARKRKRGEQEVLGESFYQRVYKLCRSTLLVSETCSLVSQYDASLEKGSGFSLQNKHIKNLFLTFFLIFLGEVSFI